ncbi:MAG: hypothetical protein QXV60_00865, partial [Nitrososphaerota archaeon]
MEKNNMSEGKRILKLILAIIGLGILIFLIILYGFKIITIEEFILLIIFFSGIGNIILDLNKLIKGKKKFYRIKFIIVSILTIISFCLILYIKTIIPFIIIVIFGIF